MPDNLSLTDESPTLVAQLPPVVLWNLRRYALNHVPVGSFLTAVLANDLREAVCRADETNLLSLRAIVLYVYNCLPDRCHGNLENVRAWLARPPAPPLDAAGRE